MRSRSRTDPVALIDAIFGEFAQQTVTVAGTKASESVKCLTRRRLNVLFPVAKHGAFYEQRTPAAT